MAVGWQVIAAVVAGIVLVVFGAVGRQVAHVFAHRNDDRDGLDAVAEFLFDQPSNPRTGTPPRKGWTTQVDERLKNLDDGQKEILNRLPKNNGRTTLSGS